MRDIRRADPLAVKVPSGNFTGRFFGPEGKTFAGTFSMIGFAFGSNSDGVTGGVIVRAP
jgi:hypothetical protein